MHAEAGYDSAFAGVKTPEVSDAEWIAELKSQIEALGDGHQMWSRGALTARCNPHVVFINGAIHKEGDDVEPTVAPVADLVRLTIEAVTIYREKISGQVNLVWRNEPEIERLDGYTRVRVRLCFEPTLIRVADGVWIEERLNLDAWGR